MSQGNLGYAFVNVTSPDVLPEFWAALNGFRRWPVAWKRPCKVSWSVPFQGIEEHRQRYRNSRLLHSSVPDELRPILLEDGVRVDFPPPTRALRAPRVRPLALRRPHLLSEPKLRVEDAAPCRPPSPGLKVVSNFLKYRFESDRSCACDAGICVALPSASVCGRTAP